MKLNIYFWSYLAQFFLEWDTFWTKFVEKIKTQILRSITFSRKSCRSWDNVERYCTAGQDTDDNAVHAQCILDNLDHKHRLRICNVYLFSTATMVARKRLSVTLYVHRLSCISYIMHHVWLPIIKPQNVSKCATICFRVDLHTSCLKVIPNLYDIKSSL